LLGRHLTEALALLGGEVTAASRSGVSPGSGVRWIHCDISSPQQVANAYVASRPEWVLHLAAALQLACERQPELTVGTNLVGTDAVLREAARSSVSQLVFASSLAAYGESEGELDEVQAPGVSTSLYGCAKWFEERLGEAYARVNGFRFTALRFSGIFGQGDVASAGMAQVRQRIESTRFGRSVEVCEANGDEKAQLTYVSDAVDATLAVILSERLNHAVYNVAGPPENYISLRGYHDAIKSLFRSAGDVTFTGLARSAGMLSTTRLRDDTGFSPSISVVEGLRRMYASELSAG
jgi:UDP-glucose 4-epimerase